MSDPIVSFDEAAMRGELKELVRRTVEDTLNALLEEEADGRQPPAGICARVWTVPTSETLCSW